MALGDFLRKQFVDVIQWTEPEEGILAYRFPLADQEIQMGSQLTVRESQMAVFVDQGRAADVFGPGRYVLSTENLPILTNLMHWDKGFESPFKSDVYFFSTRHQTNQRWGTSQPVTIRDRDFGSVRLRGFGIYSWALTNPLIFHAKVSGTREIYRVADLEGQLRNTIVSRFASTFAESGVPFLDMAANQHGLATRIGEGVQPAFGELGLHLETLVVESLSLPEELQKRLDERIGMNMVGDLGRYSQYQAAQALPIAAANPGGAAGAGVGLGAGIAMGQQMADAMRPRPSESGGNAQGAAGAAAGAASSSSSSAAPGTATKFCLHCGKSIARQAKFCPECGGAQE